MVFEKGTEASSWDKPGMDWDFIENSLNDIKNEFKDLPGEHVCGLATTFGYLELLLTLRNRIVGTTSEQLKVSLKVCDDIIFIMVHAVASQFLVADDKSVRMQVT